MEHLIQATKNTYDKWECLLDMLEYINKALATFRLSMKKLQHSPHPNIPIQYCQKMQYIEDDNFLPSYQNRHMAHTKSHQNFPLLCQGHWSNSSNCADLNRLHTNQLDWKDNESLSTTAQLHHKQSQYGSLIHSEWYATDSPLGCLILVIVWS